MILISMFNQEWHIIISSIFISFFSVYRYFNLPSHISNLKMVKIFEKIQIKQVSVVLKRIEIPPKNVSVVRIVPERIEN